MKSFLKKLFKRLLLFSVLIFTIFAGCSKDDDSPDTDSGTTNTLIADAGIDQTAEIATEVTLDGSGSKDTRGGVFNYSWVFLSQPSGSMVVLNNPTAVAPSFIPDISGVYEIELEVSNSEYERFDTVVITVSQVNGTVDLGGQIREDIVLKNLIDLPGVPDYCVTSDIDLGAVMTIEPGVELHFDADLSFKVGNNGVIIAKGTAENHIVFTAKDASTPWRGIGIVSSDDFRNAMDYVDISYAGIDNISIVDRKAALGISSFSTFSFTNSSITYSEGVGMFVDADVELKVFENNRFENSVKAPLVLPADQVGQLDTASQFGLTNGTDMVEILDGNVDLDEPTFWKPMDDGTPYFVTDDIAIGTTSELNIMPGVSLYFDVDKYMRIDGVLIAVGTAEKPILFSAKDSTLPWRGIGILSDSFQNIIDHAEISYAGADTISILSKKVALGINSFDALAFTNSTISNSVNDGMLIEDSAELTNFENNRFENNAGSPLLISSEMLHQLDVSSQFGMTNGNDYVEVLGEGVDYDEEVTWIAFTDGTPYLLTGDLSISSGVNVMPNVEFLIQSDLSIRVQSEGFLSAKGGSEAGRIVFTAFDPLLPWQGISFLTDDIRNELDFVEVSYAGSDQMGNIVQIANIGVGAFDELKITNSIVSNGLGYGISVDDNAVINSDVET